MYKKVSEIKKHTVAVVDDHQLFRSGIQKLINDRLPEWEVLMSASDGKEFISMLEVSKVLPEIVILDISMPGMDGFETSEWLKKNYPAIKILVLTMYDGEDAIVRMLKNGVKGYLTKSTKTENIIDALIAISENDFYYSDFLSAKLIHSISNMNEEQLSFSARELEVLELLCSELTVAEIADKLFISPRTVDAHRDNVFKKLNVKTRQGLLREALKRNLIEI